MTSPLPRASDAAALSLHVDRRRPEPLNVQLGRQLRELILARRLAPGARLPSTRALAGDLGISRATVVLAFDQLASEGYLEGRHGSGVYVAEGLPETALQVAPAVPRRSVPARAPEGGGHARRPFELGATDASLFPYREWARLLYRTWRSPDPALTGPLDAFGWRPLRAAIAAHLHEWRGISSSEQQIVITSGTADAIELISRVAFAPRSDVYVEEPGYPMLRFNLASLGLTPVPVPVDEDGFDIGRAAAMGPASGAIVTPSRQFPLGGTLPVGRRLELLDWASRRDAFVVEDDFDSEYRYQGSPLPALTSLDRNGRTIYVGSFSKVLSSSLRLGFVVLPASLVKAARRHLGRRGTLASHVAQPALAELIAEGAYATHIRRTRRIYARRMAALIDSAEHLSGIATLSPTVAGMHIVADLDPALSRRMSDRQAAERLMSDGIMAAPLSDYYAGPALRQGLLLGFAGFEEEPIRAAVRRMSRALARR